MSTLSPPPLDEDDEQVACHFLRTAPTLVGADDLGIASAPVKPWPHQLRTVRRAVERFPQGFLFCDEVGLGKTVEALLALRQLLLAGRVKRALILVPKALLRQWQEELHEKAALDVPREPVTEQPVATTRPTPARTPRRRGIHRTWHYANGRELNANLTPSPERCAPLIELRF